MSERANESHMMQAFIALNETVEYDFCDKIDEDDFFSLLDAYDIDLSELINKKSDVSPVLLQNFNQFLFKCKRKLGIQFADMLIYLEKRYTTFSKLVEFLDAGNKHVLIRELTDKYGMSKVKDKLTEFLE
jgi:hypothetical protein